MTPQHHPTHHLARRRSLTTHAAISSPISNSPPISESLADFPAVCKTILQLAPTQLGPIMRNLLDTSCKSPLNFYPSCDATWTHHVTHSTWTHHLTPQGSPNHDQATHDELRPYAIEHQALTYCSDLSLLCRWNGCLHVTRLQISTPSGDHTWGIPSLCRVLCVGLRIRRPTVGSPLTARWWWPAPGALRSGLNSQASTLAPLCSCLCAWLPRPGRPCGPGERPAHPPPPPIPSHPGGKDCA